MYTQNYFKQRVPFMKSKEAMKTELVVLAKENVYMHAMKDLKNKNE